MAEILLLLIVIFLFCIIDKNIQKELDGLNKFI